MQQGHYFLQQIDRVQLQNNALQQYTENVTQKVEDNAD